MPNSKLDLTTPLLHDECDENIGIVFFGTLFAIVYS